MAKKKKKIDTLVKRAEKLFKAGNYAEALEKFTKAQKKLNSPKIEEKLAVCRREATASKVKELISRGDQFIKENNLSGALDCFKEAADLSGDPGLTEKVRHLSGLTAGRQTIAKARAAADSGDLKTAAGLYEKAAGSYLNTWDTQNDQASLSKAAVCLVKAGDFSSALDLFGKLAECDDQARYHFGVALAGTGDYEGALEQWQALDSMDTDFLNQRSQVLAGAVDRLFNDLKDDAGESGIELKLKRAEWLWALARPDHGRELADRTTALLRYCRIMAARIKWEAADYEGVDHLLGDDLWADPELIRLKGTVCYHLSKDRAEYLGALSDCWMDAVCSPHDWPALISGYGGDPGTIQDRLIGMGHMQINNAAASDEKHTAVKRFDILTRLMADLEGISRKSDHGIDICSPGYAALSGRSDKLLGQIKENKAYFRSEEHFFDTGGYYSRAGSSLWELKTGNLESAIKTLERFDTQTPTDEFTQYVRNLVSFKYGLKALEAGDQNHLDYFSSTHLLFEAAPSIEDRFSDEMLKYEDEHLLNYEALVVFLHGKRPSEPLRQALCVLMGRAAIRKYNNGRLTDKQFRVIIQKALDLDPDNPFVLQLMDESDMDLEADRLFKAMSKRKLETASLMARDTKYPEVREHFFSFGEEIAKSLKEQDLPAEFKTIELKQLLDACNRVNPHHPLVDTVRSQIKTLEG